MIFISTRGLERPSATLRERRDWSILQHPIDVQVDVLVVETEQVFNLRALGNWRRITPHDVLDELVAHPSRVDWTAISDDPKYLGQLEPIFEGMRKAGLPEE